MGPSCGKDDRGGGAAAVDPPSRTIRGHGDAVEARPDGRGAGTESTVTMGQGISEVLPFAIGIAISPVPIIAIILILFSDRARSNGLSFLAGWVIGLAAVSTVVYLVSDAANAGSDSLPSDSLSRGKVVVGVLLLGLARREFAKRPAPG